MSVLIDRNLLARADDVIEEVFARQSAGRWEGRKVTGGEAIRNCFG
jgi:hypothetical protein